MIARRSLAVAALPLVALVLAGCPKKNEAASDAGTDSAPAREVI